jgi:YVTN family beta-propeller protein
MMYQRSMVVTARLRSFVGGARLAVIIGAFVTNAAAAPAYFPDGNAVGPGIVSVVDTMTQKLRPERYLTPIMPAAAVPSLDGRRLYVISLYERLGTGFPGILTVFSTETRQPLKSFSTASEQQLVAVSPDSRRVYANDGANLLVIDADTLEPIVSIPIDAPFSSLAFSPDSAYAYAITTSDFYVINLRSNAVVQKVAIAQVPRAVLTSPDGRRAYVAHAQDPGAVSVIDTATRSVVKVIPTAPDAVGLALTPDGQRLYVAHSSGQLVTVIDASDDVVLQTISMSVAPSAVDITPDGRFAYVASRGSNSVAVLSTKTNTVLTTITGFPGSFGVTTPGNFIGPEPGAAVEFYNASLDHYFISSNPGEVSDLDRGVHKGWVRTRQSISTYVTGTSMGRGEPTCRFYGLPSAGLDSHFYSASKRECDEVSSKFADAWTKESDNVFEVALPAVTGACVTGTQPVYRLWNGRSDSNHRYTTHSSTRQQMIAKGYISEGYGPDGIAMCAPEIVE